MQDESTYGFSKADASELLQSIGGSENDYREGLVRGTGAKNVVRVKNTTGSALEKYDVVPLGDVVDATVQPLVYEVGTNRFLPLAALLNDIAAGATGLASVGYARAKVANQTSGILDVVAKKAYWVPSNTLQPGKAGNVILLSPYSTTDGVVRTCEVILNSSDQSADVRWWSKVGSGIDFSASYPGPEANRNRFSNYMGLISVEVAANKWGYRFVRPGYYKITTQIELGILSTPSNVANFTYRSRLAWSDGVIREIASTVIIPQFRQPTFRPLVEVTTFHEVAEDAVLSMEFVSEEAKYFTHDASDINSDFTNVSMVIYGRYCVELVEAYAPTADYTPATPTGNIPAEEYAPPPPP